jgi:hypothetical protein
VGLLAFDSIAAIMHLFRFCDLSGARLRDDASQTARGLAGQKSSALGRNLPAIRPLALSTFSADGDFLMSDYRISRRAYGIEPTIDWCALFVLSSFLSVAMCVAMAMLH